MVASSLVVVLHPASWAQGEGGDSLRCCSMSSQLQAQASLTWLVPVLVASIIVLHLERWLGSELWMWVVFREDGSGPEDAVGTYCQNKGPGGTSYSKTFDLTLWGLPVSLYYVRSLPVQQWQLTTPAAFSKAQRGSWSWGLSPAEMLCCLLASPNFFFASKEATEWDRFWRGKTCWKHASWTSSCSATILPLNAAGSV